MATTDEQGDDEQGLALVVTVPSADVELASDRLWSLGVLAVEERHPDAIAGGDGASGLEPGVVELWTSLGADHDRVAAAVAELPDCWPWRLVEIDPSSTERWRDHASPTWIDDELVVAPAWTDHQVSDGRGGAVPTVLRIDPGAAFGLGDHPTTIATLRALRSVHQQGANVLDVGCGSGVLAIAAAVAGASEVRATDTFVAAVDATTANAERNGVAHVIDVDASPLHEIDGNYELVLANILAPTLVELADDLRRVMAPGGILIVSGLLADRTAHVLDALWPLSALEVFTVDGWVAIVLSS